MSSRAHARPPLVVNPVQDSAEALASLQMNLDRDHLATLRAVVDAGTFDAAAAALSVTPSAVSQRIKALEQQLGRVLVERSKPVRATESGEVLLRLAREIALLEADAAAALRLDDSDEGFTSVPLAVNADSLTSWFLPAIASVCTERRIVVDIHREDQDRTAELLASGRVMAAVTSRADPVAGCSSTPLGVLVYHPAASRAFAERWFRDAADAASFARAPVVDFDHDDELQTRFLRSVSRRLRPDPPRGARLPPGPPPRSRRALGPRRSGCGILRPRPRRRLRPRRRAADALPAQRLAAGARPAAPLRLGLERLPAGHRAGARLGHAAGIAARGCRTRRVRRASPRRLRRRGRSEQHTSELQSR